MTFVTKVRFLTVAAISLAAWNLPARAEEWSKTWAVAGTPELHVGTNDGSVTVKAGDTHQIEARVTTVGWKIGPDDVKITEHQTGDRVDLDVHLPRHHWEGGHHSVHIDLLVPAETRTNVETGDGRINVQSLKAPAHLTTGDGSIEVEGMDGSLFAKTGDGHIRAKGRLDVLDIETGDGSVEAQVFTGSHMTADWRVKTGDGHVTIALPENFQANLEAHTGDGHISIDFPVTVSGKMGGSDIHAKINGGGPTLRVHTGDGAIHLAHL
jgi:DUF4097 and DUF4098 domain-containing protein YvlB